MKGTSLILACVLWAATQAAPGRTIRVPADYLTIQGAINASVNGDEIVVSPGPYQEYIQFRGENIVLRSTDPLSSEVVAATVIANVTFSGPENTSCVLSGFTITRGHTRSGGGICGNHTSATIEHNVISNNESIFNGAGLYQCDGLIQNNIITGNTAIGEWSMSWTRTGGGLDDCDGVIQNNVISGNLAAGDYYGLGGGLYGCDGIIQNNVIFGNRASGLRKSYGGGLSNCNGTIRNNTIWGNVSDGEDAAYGGGLYSCAGTLQNCIVWGNTAISGPQISASATPTYSCIEGWVGGETGNIGANPQLADPAHGDFHLLSSSPCIDAGGAVPLTEDFEGDPRPYDFTSTPRGDGSNYDIGADEVVPFSRIASNPERVVQYARQGTNAATQTLTIWNAGNSILNYGVAAAPSWVTVTPPSGSSNGSTNRRTHRIAYRTASFSVGDHSATITITAPLTWNSPARIPVNVSIGTVTVVSPTAGESWVAGTVKRIQWQSHGPCNSVAIEVRRPGYVRSLGTATTVEGLNSCSVRLPRDLPDGADYVVRVAWSSAPTVIYGESGQLAIRSLVVSITWPRTGAVWTAGTAGTVTWTCANLPAPSQMDLELVRGSTTVKVFGRVVCQNGPNAATVAMPVDVAPGTDYQIRLRWAEDPTFLFLSQSFAVIGPLVNITRPTSSTIWTIGTSGTVTWTCANLSAPSQVDVDLWGAGRVVRYLGRSSCQNGTNSKAIFLPLDVPPATGYQIRLSWTENPLHSLFSLPFEVAGPSIFASPTVFVVPAKEGTNPPPLTLRVSNSRNGTLSYECLTTSAAWLHVAPPMGQSSGGVNVHTVSFDTTGLPLGRYNDRILVTGNAINNPVAIPVRLTVRPLMPRTITVGQGTGYDYRTIQAAIEGAYEGDEIIVSTGTYTENLRFLGENIALRSTDPTSSRVVASTVIDGNTSGSVVTFAGNEGSTCVLSGFTITRGRAYCGGGILGNLTRASIQYNIITSNTATAEGGGLYQCDGTIQSNLIRGNYADGWGGGGLCRCNGIVQNNIVWDNQARWGGGFRYCNARILNNTVYGNRAIHVGGGLMDCQGDRIRNCIVWNNSPSTGWQQYDYSCIQNWTGGGTGNITVDPQLADPEHGDFHLLPTSPCIDAGGTVTLTVDFEGDLRPQTSTLLPRGDGSHFDIGADEAPAVPTIASDPQAMFNAALVGTDAETRTLTVWNATGNTLAYVLDTTPSWLVATPRVGFSDGPASRTVHQIGYRTASLLLGDHAATITITDPSALNSPLRIPVRMRMVTTATVTVLTPAGGESWAAGTRHRLDWESHGPWEWVRIEARRPGESRVLATAAPNHEGTNSLTVQLPRDLAPANDWRIWVAWAYCPNLAHDESEPFTVAPTPLFAITDPMSGRWWRVGDWQTVKWTCQNNPSQIRAYLAICRGTTIVRNWTSVACHDGANSATLRLFSDLQPASDYRLLMIWMGDSLIYYWSQPFTIIGPLTCSITRPISTTKWAPGAWGAVQWTCQYNPDNDPMYLSIWRGGALVRNWSTVPCRNGANSVNARMFPTLAPGSDYRVLMTWLRRRSVVCWSQPFEIVAPPTCAITNPTSSTSWASGSAVDIEWTCADNPNGDRMYLSIWRGNTIVRNWSSVPCQNGVNHVGLPLPAGLPPATDYRLRMSWMNDFSVYWWSPTFTVQ